MAAKDEMLTLPLDKIEKYYHTDGKLPLLKEAICYHAKDLLVHPAAAVVISKTFADTAPTRDKIKQEILEVLERFNQVKADTGL